MKKITKGVIVRKIKNSGAFNGEDVDIHGLLEDASVDARQGVMDYRVIAGEMDRGNYKQFAFCDVKKIIQKGGQVFVKPVPGNRNHCVITGLTIRVANNLFSNHINWLGSEEQELFKMNTYRVYIARPLSVDHWNWADTILDYSAQQALSSSYQKWVASNPKIPVPPLNQCRHSVSMINKVQNGRDLLTLSLESSNSEVTASQKAFMDAIQAEVSKILSTELDGEFETVNYPSGFNYGITYGNDGNYNKATLQDIDTMLSTSQAGLPILNGTSFSNYYAQMMPNIVYKFSQKDQQTMQKQDTAASGQISSILTEFQNAGGKYSDPLPFGGKLQDVFNQLIKDYGSLDNIPDTMNALRNAIASYKAIAAESYALHDKFYKATARIAAIKNNVTTPTAKNGGMEVNTGSYFVGYTPNKLPTANQLIGGLATDANAIEVDLNLDNFSSKKSNLSINGKVGFSIPIADILDIGINASSSYNLSKYTSSSTKMSINIKYKGVTHFASMPSVLSTDLKEGWYALDILQEVVNNSGKDSTGYQLTGSEYATRNSNYHKWV